MSLPLLSELVQLPRPLKDEEDLKVKIAAKLEKEGFVEPHMGGATAKRGGRRKKIYKVTQLGLEELKAIKKNHDVLWADFPVAEKA